MSYRPYEDIISEASGQSTATKVALLNMTGLTIPKNTPVSIDDNGRLKLVDVSDGLDAFRFQGLTEDDIPDGEYGDVVKAGKVANVISSFAFGDNLFVGKDGNLTNSTPDEGSFGFVSGDYVLRVGAVARNDINPSQKDYLLSILLVGQL